MPYLPDRPKFMIVLVFLIRPMDETIAPATGWLDEINLSSDRAVAVVDLVFGYAAANSAGLPNMAQGTLLNAMQIIQEELDKIRNTL